MDDTLKSKCVVSVHVTPGNDRNKHKMNGLGAWRHLAQGLREGGIRDQTCLEGGGKLWETLGGSSSKGSSCAKAWKSDCWVLGAILELPTREAKTYEEGQWGLPGWSSG